MIIFYNVLFNYFQMIDLCQVIRAYNVKLLFYPH